MTVDRGPTCKASAMQGLYHLGAVRVDPTGLDVRHEEVPVMVGSVGVGIESKYLRRAIAVFILKNNRSTPEAFRRRH